MSEAENLTNPTGRPLKVLSIWHGAVRALNRERYDALARTGDLDLAVLAPRRWEAALPRPMEIEEDASSRAAAYRLIVANAVLRSHAAFHFYPGLLPLLARLQPDLVDLYEEPYTLIAWLVAWWRNQFSPTCRLVFTTCQNIAKRYPPPFCWTERYVLRSADAAMALNREALEVFRAKGYDGPFEVVPTGIDPASFHRVEAGDLRAQLGLTRPTVGYLGRLVEEKGVAVLLEAAAASTADFQLLIVGDGPEKGPLRRLASHLGLDDRIAWAGAAASAEVARYISCMDVLVLPSLSRPNWKEQLGRVLFEAMACDVPVIGSRSGAIPDVVGDAGLLFREADAGELKAAIERLLGDEALRRELARRGRARVEEHFAWPAVARRIRDLWRRALDRPPLEIRRRLR